MASVLFCLGDHLVVFQRDIDHRLKIGQDRLLQSVDSDGVVGAGVGAFFLLGRAFIVAIDFVVLAVDLSDASWRDFLMGFFDYAKRNTHWFMRVVQSNEELEKSVAESHGVVIGIQNPGRVISACARHKVPFAVVASESLPPPGTGVPSACVRNDNEGIGRFCAECFMASELTDRIELANEYRRTLLSVL